MMGRRLRLGAILATAAMLAMGSSAHAVELITNGGFETGDFSGWGTSNTDNAIGFSINDGSFDPFGPFDPIAPISGNFDAVSSQTGFGQNNLFQQVLLPTSFSSIVFSWSDRIQNRDPFSDPDQEFRVLLVDIAGSVISNVFSTNPGDPQIQLGPNDRSFDVTAALLQFAGQTVGVRFEEQSSSFFFNATIDNVSLEATAVPEPTTLALAALGIAAIGFQRRRKLAAV